jgi:hypothetical protein
MKTQQQLKRSPGTRRAQERVLSALCALFVPPAALAGDLMIAPAVLPGLPNIPRLPSR